ncbi:hypothetical protein [Nocardioides zeae]|uniref:hypothetical protein n=1 Tax=Nocardioides zeae TaxID=1457234 RepID=UPI0013D12051|nr:hypothetical protein [Nocardioides zeae]
MGVTQTVLRGIEAGTSHAGLTLGEIQRLAALLSLPHGQLLTAPTVTEPAAGPAGPPTAAEHRERAVKLVSALLIEINRTIPEQTLVELAEVSLSELDAVLGELESRLSAAGLCVRIVHGGAFIRSVDGSLDRDSALVTWRWHLGRDSLNMGQEKLLQKLARGAGLKNLGNDERVRGAALVNAGILTTTCSDGFALAEDASFSLHGSQ